MPINTVLAESLVCDETDLPGTSALFRHFEQAGIPAEDMSPYALLRCARVAIREEVFLGHVARNAAADTYNQIHDIVVETRSSL